MELLRGGERGHETAVACLAAPGEAGAAVAGAPVAGRVRVDRGTGQGVLLAGGGGGMWTSGGCDVLGGARGSGSGGSGALGGDGGGLGSGSGASERLRRGGAVGSVSAGNGCALRGGSGSAAVCGTGHRRGARLASEEVSARPRRPCVVPPGTRGRGGEVPHPPLISRVGMPRRRRLVVRVE